MTWPEYKRAKDLVGTVFPEGISEAVILFQARKHGIGRKMGRSYIFSADDCYHLFEVLLCPSVSSVGQNRHIGSSAAPSGEYALKKALALATNEPPRKSAPSAKPKSSQDRSTVIAL